MGMDWSDVGEDLDTRLPSVEHLKVTIDVEGRDSLMLDTQE